jgi:hypothetical protein
VEDLPGLVARQAGHPTSRSIHERSLRIVAFRRDIEERFINLAPIPCYATVRLKHHGIIGNHRFFVDLAGDHCVCHNARNSAGRGPFGALRHRIENEQDAKRSTALGTSSMWTESIRLLNIRDV